MAVLSKVIELIIGKQLVYFLDSHHLLCNEQFGFMKGLSTINAVISSVEKVLDCYEKRYFAAITFCDQSKAFDRVPHKILIKKLEYYHIRGNCLKLFQSYLSNRSQYVITDSSVSSYKPVTCGVPQGSVLGPLMFLVAIFIFISLFAI